MQNLDVLNPPLERSLDQQGLLNRPRSYPPRPNLCGRYCSDWSSLLTGGLSLGGLPLGIYKCVKREYSFGITALVVATLGFILHRRVNHLKFFARRGIIELYFLKNARFLETQNKKLIEVVRAANREKEVTQYRKENDQREFEFFIENQRF